MERPASLQFIPHQQRLEEFRIKNGSPQNFLSFAATWHQYEYVESAIKSQQIPLSADELSELLLCATMYDDLELPYRHQFSIPVHPGFCCLRQRHLITYLVQCGANVHPDLGKCLWTSILEIVVAEFMSSELFSGNVEKMKLSNLQMIAAFLEQGANRYPILHMSGNFGPYQDCTIHYCIDSAIAPIADWIETSKAATSEFQGFPEAKTSIMDKEVLQVWFRPGIQVIREAWNRLDLNIEQAQELHLRFKAVLNACSRRTIGEIETEHEKLQDMFFALYETFKPRIPAELAERYCFESSDESSDHGHNSGDFNED